MINQISLEEKIYEDIESKIREYYEKEKIKIENQNNPKEILADFLSYVERLILPTKRKVYYSDELLHKINSKKIKDEQIDVLTRYKEAFLEGKDMNCFLSKNVKKFKKGDLLLYTWYLFHLHMSGKFTDMKHMNNRSDTQLLCIIDSENVYFIDVIPHPERSEQYFDIHSLEIIVNSGWINQIGFIEIPEVIPGSLNFTTIKDEDIFELYRNAINMVVELNGKYYMPNPLSGTRRPVDATLKQMEITKHIKALETQEGTYIGFQFGHDKNGLIGIVEFKKKTGESIFINIF